MGSLRAFVQRSAEWLRRNPVRAATLAGWYQQGCSVVSGLLIIPFLIHYLGAERAGIWFTRRASFWCSRSPTSFSARR